MPELHQKKLVPIIFLISLIFYSCTAAPVITFVDSGELAAVIGTRGVPHPPGFPLYLLLGSFIAAIPFGSLIWRLNAFSAICGAIGVAFTFLVYHLICSAPLTAKSTKQTKQKSKLTNMSIPNIDAPWIGALSAAFALMTNRALWNTSTVTEVYSLHLMLIAIFCFVLISYARNTNPFSTKYLAIASVIAGLAISNYPPFGLLAPGVLFYVYRHEKRLSEKKRWISKLWMIALIAAGLAPYLLLPIRANSDPLLNWGNPSTLELFWKHVTASQYKIFLGAPDFALLSNAFSLWWDQWPAPIWLLLLPGIVFLWQYRRDEFYLLLLIGIANIFYVLSYDIVDVASAPSDYYAYLLPLCWASAIWIGAGVQSIFLALQKLLQRQALSIATSVILIVAIPTVTAEKFWENSNRHDYTYADDFARSILSKFPQNSLILAPDWTFVSPSLYLQHAENFRSDVVVLDSELLRRSWYFRYLEKRAPWLAKTNQNEIEEFLNELLKYEADQPYDSALITEKYAGMLNSFIATALRVNRPPHILLNLEPKELDPQTYRQFELALGRPPLITAGVTPDAIGKNYQWVPENLAFRLYADNSFHSLQPIQIPPRALDQSRNYDSVTRGVIARYAEFWRWRGDYLRFHQKCEEATKSYEQALQLIPQLTEATEGLSECVVKLLSES